jgi:NAD(P)H-dependent flavin oxidoreductase YrpB (nitropropane dioxygenase family)
MPFLPSKIPLIQAPMAGAQGPDLAIAVCRAGGLGSLPCAMLTPDLLRKEIAAIRAVTEAPFNANFFCHVEPTPDPAIETRWRSRLAAYYIEAGIDPSSIPAARCSASHGVLIWWPANASLGARRSATSVPSSFSMAIRSGVKIVR